MTLLESWYTGTNDRLNARRGIPDTVVDILGIHSIVAYFSFRYFLLYKYLQYISDSSLEWPSCFTHTHTHTYLHIQT